MIDPNNRYTKMQEDHYNSEADKWTPDNLNPVVGNWNAHESSNIYDNLFTDIDTKNMVALDFACGPGRLMNRYHDKFKRIDGADISGTNINKAITWLARNNKDANNINLYKTNGVELDGIPDNIYDIVYSAIALQHIPVHEIRFNLFQEMYRVLKIGGLISIQMGFGPRRANGQDYYSNCYEAGGTNGNCDTLITDEKQIREDLEKIGFKNFSYILTECVSDDHNQWIFFKAYR